MPNNKTYQINNQKVIAETLDGETIIINLENGNYFSINQSGSVAWELLVAGGSLEQIVRIFVDRYESPSTEIEKSISDLILRLITEELIMESDASTSFVETLGNNPKEPFIIPLLEKYEDMQEMLLADPIHDVNAMGWPKLK